MLNLINLGAGGHGNGVFHGADFRFPITAEYELAIANGFDGWRVAHMWYCLQPAAPTVTNNLAEYKKSLAEGRRLKPDCWIVIEDHRYGARTPARQLSGSLTDWNNRAKFDHPNIHTVDSARALARFYGAALPEYKDDPRTAFECGNEMVGIQGLQASIDIQNAFFDEMREQGFVKNILIGTTSGWGGITNFEGEANTLRQLRCNVVSGHRYFDPGNEGNDPRLWDLTDANATDADLGAKVSSRLAPERRSLVAARNAGLQVFWGEYGLPNTALGLAVVPHMLAFFKEFADTLWGAAPWIATEWSADDHFAKIRKDSSGKLVATGGMLALAKHWPVVMEGKAPAAPPPPVEQSTLTMTRVSPETVTEGQAMTFRFDVSGGKVGQSFVIVQDGVMDAADFDTTLAQSFAGKDGVSFTEASATAGKVTLTKAGDFSLIIDRPVKADGVLETLDKAGWVAGNQEQMDLKILDLTGGLLTSTRLSSNWATDQGGAAPPPVVTPPQPQPVPADDGTLKARVAELEALLAASKAAEAAMASQLAAVKAVIAEVRALNNKIGLDANTAENAMGRVQTASKRVKALVG